MMNVDEFLLARLAEEEQLARESHSILLLIGSDPRVLIEGSDERNTYLFIEKFNPARVLREIAAKRRIVEDYRISRFAARGQADPRRTLRAGADAFQAACLSLALAYRDHPDYLTIRVE